MAAEVSNPGCPWGAHFSEQELDNNQQANSEEIERLIELANRYPDIVFSVSVGNEATVDWTDHLVPVESFDCSCTPHQASDRAACPLFAKITYPGPISFRRLRLSWILFRLHTYPVWEYKTIEAALEYTQQNYYSVADVYPGKPVVITEAGWTTSSNGRGIDTWNASQELQAIYYRELVSWTREAGIFTFVFEAFDEPGKALENRWSRKSTGVSLPLTACPSWL